MKNLSNVAHKLEGQQMFQILQMAKNEEESGREILHFEIGDPDFETPVNIKLACIKSLMDNDTHYVPSSGMIELKEAAQKATYNSRKFYPKLNQILVTPGANAQIYYALMCTVNPGDEVIVPDPAFVSYYSILKMIGAKIVRVPLKEKNAFRLDPADVEKAITPFTRMIIMNSPSNPTGAVMTKDEVADMHGIAMDADVYLLSDEIYASMTYGRKFFSPSVYDNCASRVIMVNGFSKTHAMTGWRLGVCTGPEEVIEKMALLLETTTSCVSPFIQKAGIEALSYGPKHYVSDMREHLQKRRDAIVDGLNSLPGVYCPMPDGAFYVWVNIKDTGMTSDEFALRMLGGPGIALCSGNIFGESCEGYVRMSYANNSVGVINEAIKKMRTEL
jgi:aspartate/methionine/tyrosine aminotransferase